MHSTRIQMTWLAKFMKFLKVRHHGLPARPDGLQSYRTKRVMWVKTGLLLLLTARINVDPEALTLH